MSMILIDTRTGQTTDLGEDDCKHYFTKADLDRNLLDGSPIRAVCGFVKEGLASPAADKPTCPTCKDLYENVMQPGDDE